MTTDLTWNAHIRSVSSKVHNALFKLRQRAWLIPRDVKKLLVQTLVISHLDYACLVYDSIPGYLKPDPYLAKEVLQCNKRLTDGTTIIADEKSCKKRWVALLHGLIEGRAFKHSVQVANQHQWITDGTALLTGRDYINCHKVRIGALPTRSTRGRHGDRSCRAGCMVPKTNNHVLQICPRTYGVRYRRVLYKVQKYVGNPHVQRAIQDLGARDILHLPAILSCRGIWCKKSAEDLLRLGTINRRDLAVIATRVLIECAIAHRVFNTSTAVRNWRSALTSSAACFQA